MLVFSFKFPLAIYAVLLGSAVTGVWLMASLSSSEACYVVTLGVFKLSSVPLELALLLDPVSASFLFTVSTIAAAVLLFSSSYMANEKFGARFHVLVCLFVASMVILIVSPNLLMVLLGWDGLGVTSYLLVVYFNSTKANNAGMITALTNRVGDVTILVGVSAAASWGSLAHMVHAPSSAAGVAVMLMLVIAAMTKSAQVPFSAWLPAAMAAPTPVSSLVHSSTLVTAGVYLMVRFNPTLVDSSSTQVLLTIGTLTMLMASVSAMFEMDMKKVVALSTLSQLGMMFCGLGVGMVELAMFHLMTHAYFKALLFISVGQTIHLSSDYQDLRTIGPGSQAAPTLCMALVANLSLAGAPFMSGFFSKDAILEMASMAHSNIGMYMLLCLSVLATAVYATRFMLLVVLASARTQGLMSVLDLDAPVFRSTCVLWPLALAGGSALIWMMVPRPLVCALPSELKTLALVLVLLGTALAMYARYSAIATYPAWSWGMMWALPLSSQTANLESLANSVYLRKLDQSWVNALATEASTSLELVALKDPTWAKSSLVFTTLASAIIILVWYLCA